MDARVRIEVKESHGVFKKGQVMTVSATLARIYCEQGWAVIIEWLKPAVGPTEFKLEVHSDGA